MKKIEPLVNAIFRLGFRMFFRLDIKTLGQVPASGPMLLVANHVSTLDGPMLYVFLQPRRIIALAKKQLWDHKFTGWVMDMWRSIPVDRENMGRESMDQCFEVLDRGEILAIAPEGTRSIDGNLQQGKAGVAFIAHKKQAPLLPVVTLGFEKFSHYFKRFRRTPITIVVGKPFTLVQKGGRIDANTRQEIVDEMMMRLAQLMPRSQWGFYKDREITFRHTADLSPESTS